VAAYVGSGQIGDCARGEALSYAYALETAQRLRHRRALKALRAIGPPPHDVSSLMKERTWVQRLDGNLRPRALWKLRSVFFTPESSVLDLPATWRAFRWTLEAMLPQFSQLNLLERAPVLRVPVFFFLGRKDHWVPPETSVAYFDALLAPSKELLWFEESGHEPFVDEAARFNAAMVERVRPVAAAADRSDAAAPARS
jgi:pimeloyl-ACP methyl ester carboxylesterase